MEHARPPPELSVEGSPAARAESWRKWWKLFSVFLKASGVYKESKDVQASLLLNLIGAEGYEIFSTFTFTKDESPDDIESLKKKFDSHFGTKVNVTSLRFKFFTRNQDTSETINQYVTTLKLLSQGCEFEHLVDGLIRDRIVCGVVDNVVRDRMLRAEELTLAKAVQICEAAEMSKEESRQIEGAASACGHVNEVRARGGRRHGQRGQQRRGGGGGRGAWRAETARQLCARCGRPSCEDVQRCPALKSTCFVCNGKGHFARVCFNKVIGKRVHNLSIAEYTDNSDDEVMFVNMVKIREEKNNAPKEWIEIIDFEGTRILFKLDTGSMLNVLSKADYVQLGLSLNSLASYNKKVYSYTGNSVPIIGECNIKIKYKNCYHSLKFVVANMHCQNILGLNACVQIGAIQRVDAVNINDYSDLFHGLGKLPGKHTIVVDKSVPSVICPARRIPMGMRQKLCIELKRMESLGVVRKVSHPTEWVNAIVLAAKKNGDIRVCLDPRALNRAVRRAHFALPTVSELAAQMRGACYFSVLDARCGFWMLELDEASSDLCTFGTPFGRYQFLRLPYGINCAPEIFHARVRQHLEDLEGTESFIDDVIVWGTTKREHDMRLEKLLLRAREVGIKFNKDKCKFGVTEIMYLGHIFDERGVRPDTAKVKAIVGMPEPQDRKALERFLGMVNYLSKFIPNYSEKVAVLRGLLKKDSEWLWEKHHTEAVCRLKKDISSAPVLTLYSNSLPIVVSVDASAGALGAVLLQAGRPVEFASLTLTDTQTRYAQIEKEMLAIVFACERFHQYLFGRCDVTVQSDHKPLEAIFKKALSAAPARLQRMMLRIQNYDFKVVYTPGKYMYVADTLSRAALPELMHERVDEEVDAQTCFMLEHLQYSNEKLQLIKKHLARDNEAKTLMKYILSGWPRSQYNIDVSLRAFWPYRGTLQYVDNLILNDGLVYIPTELRGEMVRRVHEGHLGIDRCKRRARDVMFWPGMARDVERAVRGCVTCALHAVRPPREPLLQHSIPDLPWVKLGSDIFEYKKKYFVILVDYFSNYVEVSALKSLSSKTVIEVMKEQFSRHGIPNELVTDNGPSYSSKEFNEFVKSWEIKHVTSSPLYAQSNGKSERTVRTVKNLIKKCEDSGQDYYLGLLNLRATPRDGVDSPAQMLMGRRLTTRLPIHRSLIEAKVDNRKNYDAIWEKRAKQKEVYDRGSRKLPTLTCNDKVVVADGNKREFMTVVKKAPEPRSYIVQDSVGRKYRRNRRHIVYRQPQGETGGDAGESADTARASSGAEQHRPALPNDKGRYSCGQ